MNDSPETRLSLIGRLHNHDDSEAWAEFVQIYEPLIMALVKRKGLQHADAAEVTQEVLGRVAGSIAAWNPDPSKGAFRGWLYRVTRNLTIDHLRRAKKLTTQGLSVDIEQVESPSDEDSREFRLEFKRQLFHWAAENVRPTFKPNNWQSFWLSTVEQLPIDDVAETLKMSRGRVYMARFRVMSSIAAAIKKRMEETSDRQDA